MNVYLDACVIVPLFITEASTNSVRAFVSRRTGALTVSDFAIAEFGAAISFQVRTGRTTAQAAMALMALFDDWATSECDLVTVNSDDIASANMLVRQFDLKLLTPHAIHLAICIRTGLPLVTLDQRLAAAALAKDVEVADLSV